jgi:hypothetical protein
MTLLSLIALPRDKYDTDEDIVPPERKKVEAGNEFAVTASLTTTHAYVFGSPCL